MYKLMSGALTCLILAGCGGGDGGGNPFADRRALAIQSCPANMTCDFMQVPKDYHAPSGEMVEVFYGVHKARDPANRIGSLILNFGGPSAPAVGGAAGMAMYAFPSDILDRFDIVGMDPRGAGWSAFADELTTCAVAEYNGRGSCDATFQQVAPYMGSNTIVKDLDSLRARLGDEQLTFLGYSYGTRLGSLYANMFPERVRAIVLDSPMSPTDANNVAIRIGNTAGYEKIAAYRLDYANSEGRPTPDRKTSYETLASDLFYDVYGQSKNSAFSYRTTDGYTLNFDAFSGLMSMTIARESDDQQPWQKVSAGLKELLDQDNGATLAQAFPTGYTKSAQSKTIYSSLEDDLRGNAHFKAVVCTDERVPLTDAEITQSAYDYYNESTLYGPMTYWQTADMCQGWSAQRDPIEPVQNMDSKPGGKQILVIGGQYDPATPYIWSDQMMAALGSSGSRLTMNNYVDHGFSYSGFYCIDQPTTDYLISPDMPVTEAVCDPNSWYSTKSFYEAKKVPHPTDNIIGW
ncbi:alpha/beta hydrolase [Photobacterium sp. TY1-4]|uniref:alpha/beta hydrolase n=1 Tax=Photobacterium sp. TY1-4 TaxID=2899122 RepID=UPI0021C1C1FB|nr:alpha/beta hydrolase [Photobacterium sp. TY1-4]UXI00734.1 alpha/beta hydrolase [Photobacterium sp. TY1-4]